MRGHKSSEKPPRFYGRASLSSPPWTKFDFRKGKMGGNCCVSSESWETADTWYSVRSQETQYITHFAGHPTPTRNGHTDKELYRIVSWIVNTMNRRELMNAFFLLWKETRACLRLVQDGWETPFTISCQQIHVCAFLQRIIKGKASPRVSLLRLVFVAPEQYEYEKVVRQHVSCQRRCFNSIQWWSQVVRRRHTKLSSIQNSQTKGTKSNSFNCLSDFPRIVP